MAWWGWWGWQREWDYGKWDDDEWNEEEKWDDDEWNEEEEWESPLTKGVNTKRSHSRKSHRSRSLTKGDGSKQKESTSLTKGEAFKLRNNKGKAVGSGTVSNKRREAFKKKGLERENLHMSKEDRPIDWEEENKIHKSVKRLRQKEIEAMMAPKKPEVKEETKDVETVAGDEQAAETAEPTSFDKKEEVQQKKFGPSKQQQRWEQQGFHWKKREWPKLSNQEWPALGKREASPSKDTSSKKAIKAKEEQASSSQKPPLDQRGG